MVKHYSNPFFSYSHIHGELILELFFLLFTHVYLEALLGTLFTYSHTYGEELLEHLYFYSHIYGKAFLEHFVSLFKHIC